METLVHFDMMRVVTWSTSGLPSRNRRVRISLPAPNNMVREPAWCGRLPVTQDIDGFESHTYRQQLDSFEPFAINT